MRAQGCREVDKTAQFEAVEANRRLVAAAQSKTSRRHAEPRRCAGQARVGDEASAPFTSGEASNIDYSKLPVLYDVQEWS